jgi:hypothetical protein
MTPRVQSAYERWTWEQCGQRILTLKNRLGYSERLWVLGFELMDDGRLMDPFHKVEVFDPISAGPVTMIPSTYSAVPEMYCILSTYAGAGDISLANEQHSLAALDPVQRPEPSPEECAALLHYSGQDFSALQMVEVPFFGSRAEHGDFAFEVWPLPRVPITVTLWQGDEEVPDGGALLFDRTATHYLRDLVGELAGLTVWRLQNILNPQAKWGYHQLGSDADRARKRA